MQLKDTECSNDIALKQILETLMLTFFGTISVSCLVAFTLYFCHKQN